MTTIITAAPIAVMKARGGIAVTTYASELEAVIAMLDNGSLGGQSAHHGSSLHVGALLQVEAAVARILAGIRSNDGDPGCRDCADNDGTCPHDGHKCGT